MDIYDSLIQDTEQLLGKPTKTWAYSERRAWKDAGSSELVLLRDAAYELGGGNNPAANYSCVTTSDALIEKDEILLYGPDLGSIKGDVPFARIALLEVADIGDTDNEMYKAIRTMEFVKYHVFPEGYMLRVSPESKREQVRVSKKAVKRGISFESVGCDYIQQYKKNAQIKKVKLIFVTDPACDFARLIQNAEKIDAMTATLNTIMQGLPDLDCDHCSFKPVCDEVEGLKELHFKKEKKN